ncbi:MAG TPA: hypothetical protein VEH29_02710 [Acidimicrobiales bacterium]|nr:hypothetical protein [Acidimicrobiales bacterium]
MADVQVEENPVHIDNEDMAAIIDAIGELGKEAEPTGQKTLLKAAWWVLVLHWLEDDTTHFAFDTFLTILGTKVLRHYRKTKKDPPARIDVVDGDHNTLASKELDETDEDDEES